MGLAQSWRRFQADFMEKRPGHGQAPALHLGTRCSLEYIPLDSMESPATMVTCAAKAGRKSR